VRRNVIDAVLGATTDAVAVLAPATTGGLLAGAVTVHA